MRIYCTPEWLALREQALARDRGLCVRCNREGFVNSAEAVHHIRHIRKGGDPWDIDNLQSLCRTCHEGEHTAKERGTWATFVDELLQEETK